MFLALVVRLRCNIYTGKRNSIVKIQSELVSESEIEPFASNTVLIPNTTPSMLDSKGAMCSSKGKSYEYGLSGVFPRPVFRIGTVMLSCLWTFLSHRIWLLKAVKQKSARMPIIGIVYVC